MLDAFIVIQKVKTRKNGEIIIQVMPEAFDNYVEVERWVINHFCAKKKYKHDFIYETEDFVYEIKELNKVKVYNSELDQIVLEEE